MRSRTAIDRLIARRDIHLWEKTLWRMLYETCARAEELPQLNIEDLGLAGRCAWVKPMRELTSLIGPGASGTH
ncbi:hypothetical protein [Nocardia sp. NPDC050710]|uniref:hypothetical protein n=1 Tax=Nocardia sp. NPDC050710 TaxID=3157220 RepID=UPI0033F7ED72